MTFHEVLPSALTEHPLSGSSNASATRWKVSSAEVNSSAVGRSEMCRKSTKSLSCRPSGPNSTLAGEAESRAERIYPIFWPSVQISKWRELSRISLVVRSCAKSWYSNDFSAGSEVSSTRSQVKDWIADSCKVPSPNELTKKFQKIGGFRMHEMSSRKRSPPQTILRAGAWE